jgi:hypothetical protein
MKICLSATKLTTFCLCILLASLSGASAFQLVTAEEAARPNGSYRVTRAVTPGPEVEVLSPAISAFVNSPFQLQVTFKAHGGATINRGSIEITYWKLPAVDVTQRIKRFIQGDAIDVANAEMPAGVHPFRILVKDNRERSSAVFFEIWVAK